MSYRKIALKAATELVLQNSLLYQKMEYLIQMEKGLSEQLDLCDFKDEARELAKAQVLIEQAMDLHKTAIDTLIVKTIILGKRPRPGGSLMSYSKQYLAGLAAGQESMKKLLLRLLGDFETDLKQSGDVLERRAKLLAKSDQDLHYQLCLADRMRRDADLARRFAESFSAIQVPGAKPEEETEQSKVIKIDFPSEG